MRKTNKTFSRRRRGRVSLSQLIRNEIRRTLAESRFGAEETTYGPGRVVGPARWNIGKGSSLSLRVGQIYWEMRELVEEWEKLGGATYEKTAYELEEIVDGLEDNIPNPHGPDSPHLEVLAAKNLRWLKGVLWELAQDWQAAIHMQQQRSTMHPNKRRQLDWEPRVWDQAVLRDCIATINGDLIPAINKLLGR